MEANLTIDWSVDDPYLIQRDASFSNEVIISPNPTQNVVFVNGLIGSFDYKLSNMNGQLVLNGKSTSRRVDIPEKLATGIYYLKILQNGNQSIKRLVIKR